MQNFVTMVIHIGEKIRQRAKELRVGPSELAKQINTSKQNIYGIYRRKSIDSELLFKLSIALEFDFFVYYQVELPNLIQERQPEYGKSSYIPRPEFEKLKQQVEELTEQFNKVNRKK